MKNRKKIIDINTSAENSIIDVFIVNYIKMNRYGIAKKAESRMIGAAVRSNNLFDMNNRFSKD